MRNIPFGLLILVALVFVGCGDQFLPQPLSGASRQTRAVINNAIVNLVPNSGPKTNPYQRTEDALKQEQNAPSR